MTGEDMQVVARVRSAAAASVGEPGPAGPESRPVGANVLGRAVELFDQALASDDAEAGGLRADDVLADPEIALVLLAGPGAWAGARHAVVQRYGWVGALLVVGFECRFAARLRLPERMVGPTELDLLVDRFAEMDARELQDVLVALDGALSPDDASGHAPGDESAPARRWLEATYALAARQGTEAAHRAYMEALERVMRLAARRLAS